MVSAGHQNVYSIITSILVQEVYSEERYLDVNSDPSFIRLDNIRVKNLGKFILFESYSIIFLLPLFSNAEVSSDNGRNIEPLELLSSDDNMSLRSLPFASEVRSIIYFLCAVSCNMCVFF